MKKRFRPRPPHVGSSLARHKAARDRQPASSCFAETRRSGRITYYLDGIESAPVTVVFVHGYGLDAQCWKFQNTHVRERAGVLAVDLRGHGLSEGFEVEECSIPAAADDLAEIIATEVPGKLVLVGHSLGGMVVMNLLRRHEVLKKRTVGVVLASTSAESFISQGAPQLLRLPAVQRARDRLAASPSQARRLKAEIASYVAPTLAATVFKRPTPDSVIEMHARMINETPLASFAGYLDDIEEHNEVAGARALQGIPGVVLVGGADRVTPSDEAENLAQLWGAGIQVIPGVGHMLPLETPGIVNKAIDQLIAGT